MRRKQIIFNVIAAFLLIAAAPLVADESGRTEEGTTNVLLTFRMGVMEDGKREIRKQYRVVVAEGTPGSSLLAGERVPFKRAHSDEGDATHSVVYQNVGFSTTARVYRIDQRRIRFVGEIEDSKVVAGENGGLPKVETRQMSVHAVLTVGEPLELTQVSGLLDLSGFVEVEAEILD